MLAEIYVQQGKKFNELITKYCVIFNNDMLKECSNKLLKKLEKKQDINNSILKMLEIWLKLEKEEKNSKFITQLIDWYF